MTTLGTTTISKIKTQADMDKFVAALGLKSDTVIIKPNWVEAVKGTHTEAESLDLLLNSLTGKKIYIVESYTFWRNQKFVEEGIDSFSSKEADFETGKIHWDFFKEGDEWFLKSSGIGKVLEKHHAKYINITNELWAGRQSIIPLVPQALYDLKGTDFISFAKLKGDADYGATLSIKNLFGLYPDPCRYKKFHQENENKLLPGIVEINRTYQELFNCYFVVEGIYIASHFDWSHPENSATFPNRGFICGGKDAVQIDSTALKAISRKFIGTLENLLPEYQKVLGGQLQTKEVPEDYKINFPKL